MNCYVITEIIIHLQKRKCVFPERKSTKRYIYFDTKVCSSIYRVTLSEDIIMAQQGAALQSYNNELVKSIEELLQRRAALNKQIEAESNEKTKLEQQKLALDERLSSVDASLQAKLTTRTEYDKVIADAEQVISQSAITCC